MKILVVGGGTGGHITPAVAVVKEILRVEPGTEIEFWTDRKNYRGVVKIFKEYELETSVREGVVKREVSESVDAGRKMITSSKGRRFERNAKKRKVVQKFLRTDIVSGTDVRVRSVFAGKFRRYGAWDGKEILKYSWIILRDVVCKNIGNLILFIIGVIQSLVRLMPTENRPDVVFLKGGFVGLPVGLVAGWLKIPYVVHESDATPGLANRILRKKAKAFCLGMGNEGEVVGIPIGEEYRKVGVGKQRELKEELGFSRDELLTIIVGGSQGSVHINEAVLKILRRMAVETQVGIVAGKGNYEHVEKEVKRILGKGSVENDELEEEGPHELEEGNYYSEDVEQGFEKNGRKVKVWDFSRELWKLFGAADIVISRAGATTIVELAEMGKAVILVPFENLPGGHQEKNARLLAEQGAVKMILDDEMGKKPEKLLELVRELTGKEEVREALSKKIREVGRSDAAGKLAEIIIGTGKK